MWNGPRTGALNCAFSACSSSDQKPWGDAPGWYASALLALPDTPRVAVVSLVAITSGVCHYSRCTRTSRPDSWILQHDPSVIWSAFGLPLASFLVSSFTRRFWSGGIMPTDLALNEIPTRWKPRRSLESPLRLRRRHLQQRSDTDGLCLAKSWTSNRRVPLGSIYIT